MTTPLIGNAFVDAARAYAARDWYVLPLHDITLGHCSCSNPHCEAPGKHPRIPAWGNAASPEAATIMQWWSQWPQANVGILTGERSGLAVLDVDPRNGGDLALEALEQTYGPLPDTAVALSGSKGPHHYFVLNSPLGKFDPGPGLNLLADGAQVVAPPSLHHSGNRYEWEASNHLDEVGLAPLPDWLRAMGEAMASTPVEGVNLPDVLPRVRLQNLQVSHRIKYLIQTGEDPDDPNRYCYPNGTPDRSRALFAVIQALLAAGHDDATIASVVMDQRYGISAKVLSQKNARNPRYWDQTKAWVAQDIARAKTKQPPHVTVNGPSVNGPATPPGASVPGQGAALQASVWDKAIPVGDFLAQQDQARPVLAQDLVVPGAITIIAAPRGTGKSVTALALAIALASGGVFRQETLPLTPVLLVDRDNPLAVVRKRLQWLGATARHTLDVLTRDDAPPLKDKTVWARFPVEKYAVVIIDSLGAATEGVSEKEGRQTQEFLATLKDLAHRGPAILALDNTNKAATSYRGRGEKADAVDILYEARDITGWTPSTADAWWESLPEYGDHTWQHRATRRKGQKVLRMAFIPSKFRLGIEPEPFAIEIDTTTMPWTLADITEHIATAGARTAEETRRQARQQVEHAAQRLVRAIAARSAEAPILKEEAVTLLRGCGLTNKTARTLLESGGNREVYPQGQWIIRPIPGHRSGKAFGVYPAGDENDVGKSSVIVFPCQYTPTDQLPSYASSALDVESSTPFGSSIYAVLNGTDLSPQPGNSTSKGGTPHDKQSYGYSQAGGPFYVPTLSSDAPAQVLPCALCGGIERWNDGGILRCVTCWPSPERQG